LPTQPVLSGGKYLVFVRAKPSAEIKQSSLAKKTSTRRPSRYVCQPSCKINVLVFDDYFIKLNYKKMKVDIGFRKTPIMLQVSSFNFLFKTH
jgi:hypothetical protein